MWFLNNIVSWLDSVSGYFYEAYQEVFGWVWPFYLLGYPLYYLYSAFYYLTHYFGEFNNWLVWAAGRIDAILSTFDIWSYFQTWFQYAQDAWSWVYNALYNVWNIVDSWWSSTKFTVLAWIADVESWTQGQLNSLRDLILALIADIESWTTTQLNNLQSTFITLISNVEAWTTTQLNNLQDAFLVLLSNVEAWTTTQLNNAKSAILAIIGNLETWTITEINTIRDTLTTLVDWTAFTNWITGWWNDRLLDLSSLINTAFLEREPFWAGWQDWRDSVTEFFTDPLQWLYNKLDEWFERFW